MMYILSDSYDTGSEREAVAAHTSVSILYHDFYLLVDAEAGVFLHCGAAWSFHA